VPVQESFRGKVIASSLSSFPFAGLYSLEISWIALHNQSRERRARCWAGDFEQYSQVTWGVLRLRPLEFI